jgi:micrococcal nuclease
MWQAIQEWVVAVLMFFGVWGGAPAEPAPPILEYGARATVATATVAYVVDGDTLELASGERVRLLGIDTPEREECYYEEAGEYLRTAVEGREVRLEGDITDVDDYDRLLRHVFLPTGSVERHLNYELVEQGYAVVLPILPDRAYREEFRAAEVSAKADRFGRHSACE